MLELILGPMYSGKTTELFRRLERHKLARRTVVMLRPAVDTRYRLTHEGLHTKESCDTLPWPVVSVDNINSKDLLSYDVIGVDEGQFFDSFICPKAGDALLDLINPPHNKHVIICALNGTSELGVWPTIQELIPHVQHLNYLTAVCMRCGADANFSFSIKKKEAAVAVGGEGEYLALCRSCYHQGTLEKS